MSPLTKLFVVLLVICSLLLTAAMVVFVNQTENFRKALVEADTKVTGLERDKVAADTAATTANTNADQQRKEASRQAAQLQGEIAKLGDELGKKGVENNRLQAQLAAAQAQVMDLTSAQKLAQQNLGDLQKRYDAIITENDKTRLANAELTGANTDYQKRLDEAERERRWLAEQNLQLKKDNTQARNLLAQNNIAFDAGPARKVVAPNLKGVIRTVKAAQGVTYATITLGSVDKVEKGMQFNVVNQFTNEFLGKLTVEAVEPNEAFGRLEGPRIQEVKPDYQVLSQL
ncbi:MAG TPA: hypothetical protein VHP11_04245 [Tepidisphaeraceae bacterium]|nr:hypothetical protein [Tepidisphaeraceae bacterium]